MAENSKTLTRPQMAQALRTWGGLNTLLRRVNEAQALQLLEEERSTRARHLYLIRLYGRYSTLRKHREKRELLQLILSQN